GGAFSLLLGMAAVGASLELALLGAPVPGWVLLVLLGVSAGVVLNTMIPLALGAGPSSRAGLRTRCLFSGLAASFVGYAILKEVAGEVAPSQGAIWLVPAALVVALCVGNPAPRPAPGMG